jgi:hypothetical protein
MYTSLIATPLPLSISTFLFPSQSLARASFPTQISYTLPYVLPPLPPCPPHPLLHFLTITHHTNLPELWRVEEAFIKILGIKPIWFRPPYGSYNDLVLQVLGERGYKYVALWTDDTGDSLGESLDHQRGVLADVAGKYPEGRMVLQHSTIGDGTSRLFSACM